MARGAIRCAFILAASFIPRTNLHSTQLNPTNFMADNSQPQPDQQSTPDQQFSDSEMEKELPKRVAYDRGRAKPQEASAQKMRAAQTGGSRGLGPTDTQRTGRGIRIPRQITRKFSMAIRDRKGIARVSLHRFETSSQRSQTGF
jgi:hypothetical protein